MTSVNSDAEVHLRAGKFHRPGLGFRNIHEGLENGQDAV